MCWIYHRELKERLGFLKYKQIQQEIVSYKTFVDQLKCSVIILNQIPLGQPSQNNIQIEQINLEICQKKYSASQLQKWIQQRFKSFLKVQSNKNQSIHELSKQEQEIQDDIFMVANNIIYVNNKCKSDLKCNSYKDLSVKLKMIKIQEILKKEQTLDQVRKRKDSFMKCLQTFKDISLLEYISTSLKINENHLNEQFISTYQNSNIEYFYDTKLTKCFWNGDQCILLMMNDITYQIIYQQAIQKYKESVMACVAHDLRSPLNAIIGKVRQIQDVSKNSIIKQKAASIEKNIQLLNIFINDILDYSQIQKGELRLNKGEFNVQHVVDEIIDIFAEQIRFTENTIIIIIENSKKFNIFNDSNRFKQVIMNLISNSLKFTEKGFIKIKVKPYRNPISRHSLVLEEETQIPKQSKSLIKTQKSIKQHIENCDINEDNLIKISIKDSGVGIPQEYISNLFNMFETFNNQNLNKQGIGLGLYICNQIVNLIGPKQQIEVKSQVRLGTKLSFLVFKNLDKIQKKKRFRSEVDLNEIGNENYNPQPHIRIKVKTMSEIKPNLNILHKRATSCQNDFILQNNLFHICLIDDDPLSLECSVYFVNKAGQKQLTSYSKPLEFLEDFRCCCEQNQQPFDIVMTDIQMPQMDGYKLSMCIQKISKKFNLKAPIIICVSSYPKQSMEEKMNAYGIDYCLEKPLDEMKLRELFNQI